MAAGLVRSPVLLVGRAQPLIEAELQRALPGVEVLHLNPEDQNVSEVLQKCVGADPQGASRVRAAITNSFNGFPSPLFALLPKLEVVANFGVGVDSIDVGVAHSRGVTVTNTPEVLTDDVADIALGLMLSVSRRLCQADRYVRAGRWVQEGPMPLTVKVTGKRVGILGLGRIGQAIAKRAEAFECPIAYWSRAAKPGVPYEYHDTPEALAASVDFLVVACALTKETEKIVSAPVLQALGPQGVLINIGRGGHVDEPALVAALTDGTVGGAGLDVFADEPNVPPELLGFDNVVLLPHVGSGTVETRQAMAELTVANVKAFLEGRPPLTPVEPPNPQG